MFFVMSNEIPSIGVIGGSGLYELPGIASVEEITVETPYGAPSDALVRGELAGRSVYFLPRHGRGHRIAPHEINHRANIWAMRSLGVRWLICVTAVGSLQEDYQPRDVLIPDQLFDRTSRREFHTFFGGGIVAHVSFGEPYSPSLRQLLVLSSVESSKRVHDGGTYVNMDGPAFSTRAESEANRKLGFDVIGMTNLPEAKLSREAEIACATLALVTDYDCWRAGEEPVTAAEIGAHLQANVETAKEVLLRTIPRIPSETDWPEHSSLDGAFPTSRSLWPEETVEKLRPILGRFI